MTICAHSADPGRTSWASPGSNPAAMADDSEDTRPDEPRCHLCDQSFATEEEVPILRAKARKTLVGRAPVDFLRTLDHDRPRLLQLLDLLEPANKLVFGSSEASARHGGLLGCIRDPPDDSRPHVGGRHLVRLQRRASALLSDGFDGGGDLILLRIQLHNPPHVVRTERPQRQARVSQRIDTVEKRPE
jgi:hypothetical protein